MSLFILFCFICFSLSVTGMIFHSFFSMYLHRARQDAADNYDREEYPESVKEPLLYHVIQLPVYNENIDMVKALLDSACAVQYPRNRLLIQLLDDSDQSETSSCLQDYLGKKREDSPDLQLFYLHRKNRYDFKAGNLNFGLEQLTAALPRYKLRDPAEIIISIFDADFLIPVDYLTRISRHFLATEIGIVQTDTIFRNNEINALTMAQTVFQNNLHTMELSARSKTGHLSMFRGSAGSLRLATIIDCGYWQGDTQIEDVDLSFLAQCIGWEVRYDDQIVCSSLLPESYNEFKLQQRSWMKGLMEVMRKRAGQIVLSKNLCLSQKIGGFDFFLILSLQALFMIIAHLTLIPAYYYWCSFSSSLLLNLFLIVFVALLFLTHIPFFLRGTEINNTDVNNRENRHRTSTCEAAYAFYLMTAMFVTLSYGLVEGLLGGKVHRHRTGKGSQQKEMTKISAMPKGSIALLKRINITETGMAIYSIILIFWAFSEKEYLIGGIYSILAMTYPVNAILSRFAIEKINSQSTEINTV